MKVKTSITLPDELVQALRQRPDVSVSALAEAAVRRALARPAPKRQSQGERRALDRLAVVCAELERLRAQVAERGS